MKTLIPLVCIFVCAYAVDPALIDDAKKKIQELGTECITTENASEADMMALLEGKAPSSHEGKCVVFCIAKALDIMHSDNTFGAGYVEWLTKVKADDNDFYTKFVELYMNCEAKIEIQADPCETATNLLICVKEDGEKVGLSELLF